MEKRKTTELDAPDLYRPASAEHWSGRLDGDHPQQLRWHQKVHFLDSSSNSWDRTPKGIAFLGFACDEGVRRNQGRMGAAEGPSGIRRACSNLPAFEALELWDIGDVICSQGRLEDAQLLLSQYVERVLRAGLFPVLLGGGHEITYGHYSGLQAAFPGERIGVINLDAHFDLRVPDKTGASSGTGFYQIYQDCEAQGRPFHYMALGIQRAANTRELFARADAWGVDYISDRELEQLPMDAILSRIQAFVSRVDRIYLTLDMDVFSAAYAPGVSAQNPRGMQPGAGLDALLAGILRTGKLASMDIAEYNPSLDIDSRTAKLAASILFDVLNPDQRVVFSDPGRH